MNKSIYLAAFAALALTACDSDSDHVFDQSAADRLEQYKKDYAEVLTADGGLWTMEYFSNDEEPGYLFVMKFDKDGSVEISANHKWIGGNFSQEVSLWKMIADNGPVISFNSYNSLFHIFSDPANITGSEAPKGDEGSDINETGYGHNGDYEFQIMEVSEDRQTMRLLGKKRMHDIFLRRLDPLTDVRKYLDDYLEMSSSLFSKEVSRLIFDDADGVSYFVSEAHTGVMSVWPVDGDPVEQTRKGNFIITNSGIRFMTPLEIVDPFGNEKEISEFTFVGNRTLASVDNSGSTISAGSIEDIFYNNKTSWKVDLKSVTGSMKDAVDAFVAQLRSLYNYKSANINEMSFDYDTSVNSYVLRLNLRISSKNNETDCFYISFSNADGKVKISVGEPCDQNSELALGAYTSLSDILNLIAAAPVAYSTISDCGPKTIDFDLNGGSLTINAI